MKRTPLSRRIGLRRRKMDTGLRGRLRPMSAKRRAELGPRHDIRLMVFARDRWTCQASLIPEMARYHLCSHRLTVHHILKASQGGGYTLENLTTLCDVANDLIESDANFARLARHYGMSRRGAGRTFVPHNASAEASYPRHPPPGPASAGRTHSADRPVARSGSLASSGASPVGGPSDERNDPWPCSA